MLVNRYVNGELVEEQSYFLFTVDSCPFLELSTGKEKILYVHFNPQELQELREWLETVEA